MLLKILRSLHYLNVLICFLSQPDVCEVGSYDCPASRMKSGVASCSLSIPIAAAK